MAWQPNWMQQMPVAHNPNMNITTPMVPEAYSALQYPNASAEQQYALQQQNWTQWQAYQQQYAQWQAQYGEQYQRELQQKMGVPAAVAMPPVPVQPPAPLPPPTTQPSPPPPPPDPEPNIRSNNAPFDNRPWQRQTGNIAPQIHQELMSRQQGYQNVTGNAALNHDDVSRQQAYQNTAVAGNATIKQDMNSRQPGYQNMGVVGNACLNQDVMARQQGYQNFAVAGNAAMNQDVVSRRQGYQNESAASMNAQGIEHNVKNVSCDTGSTEPKSSDVEGEKSAEELAFDQQFRNWENEFIKWKQQNLNHPDRKAYIEYEEKMEQCRTKLLERREQMRRRKIDKNLTSEAKTIAPLAQEPLKNPNVISAPILPDHNTARDYGFGTKQANVDNQDDVTDLDARYQGHDDTKTNCGDNFMNNFPITGKVTGGIPGLDLIDEKRSPVKTDKNIRRQKNSSSDVYDLEDRSSSETNRSNFDEISKGINNILGDPNLVSLLSNFNNPVSSTNDRNRSNSQPDEFNDTQNNQNPNISEDIQPESCNNQINSTTNRYGYNNVPVNNQSDMFNSRGDSSTQQNQGHFNSQQNITANRFNNSQNLQGDHFGQPGEFNSHQNSQDNLFNNQQNNQGDRFTIQQGGTSHNRSNPPNLRGDHQSNQDNMFNNQQNNQGDRFNIQGSNNHPNFQGGHQDNMFNNPQNHQGVRFTTQQGGTSLNRSNNPPNFQGDHDNIFKNQQNNQDDRFTKQQGSTPLNRSNNVPNLKGDHQNNQENRFNNQNNRFSQQNNPFDRFNQPISHGDRNLQNNNNQNDRFNSENDRFNNRPFGNDSNNFTNLQNMQNASFRNQPDNFQNQTSDFRNDEFRNRPDRTNSFPSQHNSTFPPQFDAENPKRVGNFGNVPFSVQPDRLSHFDDSETTSNCSNNFEGKNLPPNLGANRFDDLNPEFRRGSVEQNLDNRKLPRPKVFNSKNPFLRSLPSGSVHSGDRSQDEFGGNDFDDRPFDSKRNFGQFGKNSMQEKDCIVLPTKIIDYEASSSRDVDEQFFKPTQIIDYDHPASSLLSTSNTKVVDYGHKAVIGGGASIPKLHGNISKVRIIDYGHQSSLDSLTFKRRITNERPAISRKKMKQQFKKERKPVTDNKNQSEYDVLSDDDTMNAYPNNRFQLINANRSRPGLPTKRGRRRGNNKWQHDDESIADQPLEEFKPIVKPVEVVKEVKKEIGLKDVKDVKEMIIPSVKVEKPKPKRIVRHPKPVKPAEPKNVIDLDDILLEPGRKDRPQKIVVLMRGPPGSGKSYLAKQIKEKEVEMSGSAVRILSIDDYFTTETDEIVTCSETGKKITNKILEYVYDATMEETYMQYLVKSFKKTVADGHFDFIIVDCVNSSLKHYTDMYNFAKTYAFTPYTCEMERSIQTCFRENIHNRSEEEIINIVDNWSNTPEHYLKLDYFNFIS